MPIRNQSLGEAAEEARDEDERDVEDKASSPAASAEPAADVPDDTEGPGLPEQPAPDTEEQAAAAERVPDVPKKTPGGGRIRARMAAVQAIYQWRMSATDIGELIIQFATAGRLQDLDRSYFEMIVRGVAHDANGLEQAFDTHLSRPAVQLDPVEYAILLLATYELRECPEIPYAAIINEATNLAKIFGATDGHRFINGVMDAVARDQRPSEVARGRRR